MIEVGSLTKYYGQRKAVDELTFSVGRGEIVGFLGQNGAGKTTTMRILTAYMPPSEGTARVAGFDVVSQSIEVRRRVGYLPETVPLYPDMTIRQYLDFMAQLRRVDGAHRDDRVDDVLGLVHMEDRADTLIANLSKGMRQRVGLAQALVHEPEVLILDEPTIGLDPNQVVEVRGIIKELGKDRTVLLSTHILPEAQQVCNRVLIIHKGRLVAEDTPERLQARLAGAERVLVRVQKKVDGAARVIGRLSGVQEVQTLSDGEIHFETQPGHDARPEVARALVEGGYGLLELRPVGMSLEEIFLELTREEPAPIEAAGEEVAHD